MHDLLISSAYFPKNYHISCAVTCKKKDALKLMNVSKLKYDTHQVGISKFHYEQIAKYHFYKDIQSEVEPPIVIHTDNGTNAKLIRSMITSHPHQVDLIRTLWKFSYYTHVTYYTDGSVQNLGLSNISSASAWIETSTVTPTTYATSIENEWTSSTKAELIAVLTAMLTAPEHSQVDIYLDSKAVIDKFKSLAKHVDTFKYVRNQLKDTYSLLWYMLFIIMETLDLKVVFHKVKALNDNKFNDMVDQIAKDACSLDHVITFKPITYFKVAPLFKATVIQCNVRRFIKDVQDADYVHKFISL